jgi:hypothetical protein
MVSVTTYNTQNWLITPAALAKTDIPPAVPYDQKFLLTLSGVASCNFTNASGDDWLRDTVKLQPDIQAVLTWASSNYFLPVPPGPFYYAFQVEQWAAHATMNSIFDKGQSIDAGFAVDSWEKEFFSAQDVINGSIINTLWNALVVNLAIRDVDAWLYRVGYTLTLLGKIRLVYPIG